MSAFTDWLDATLPALGYRNDADFSRALGSSQSNISRWRKGSQPEISHLVTVGEVLGVGLETLLVLSGYCPSTAVRKPDPPRALTAAEADIDGCSLSVPMKDRVREYWTRRMDEERRHLGRIIDQLGEHPRQRRTDALSWLVEMTATTRAADALEIFAAENAPDGGAS